MSEEILIRQGAPTLAGIKTGSLFPCPCDDREALLTDVRRLNRQLVPKGLCLLPIRFKDGQALLYLYRPAVLHRDLQDGLAQRILTQAGYACGGCGRCVACMTICPTGAIVEPYTVDARRCISYLTIELEGAIPEEFRPLIGNRIYGCDDCQLICPWNRYSQLTDEEDFSPRKALHAPQLVELFAWTEAWFLKVTEGSAIRRIGHLRWLRNVAVALGNAPWDEANIRALESRKGEHPLLDEHIEWAIAQQIEKRNACTIEVQLPKKQRLVRVIEKGLTRDA